MGGSLYDGDYDHLRPIVARFRVDGSLDPGFGQGGYVLLEPGSPDTSVGIIQLAVSPSGSIILLEVGGHLRRLTASGEIDRSFGSNGLATLDGSLGIGNSPDNLTLDSAGRIVVAGSSGQALAIERLTADGSPDSTFDGDGLAVASPVPASSLQGRQSFQRGGAVAVRPDDRLLVVGEAILDSGDAEVVAAQFGREGALDASFNDDGMTRIPVTAPGGSASNPSYYATKGIALDAAGSAVVRLAPETAFADMIPFCGGGSALRLDADGALDTEFGGSGFAPSDHGCPRDFALLDTGGLFAVGEEITRLAPSSATQTLYTADGQFDAAFGPQPRKLMIAGHSSRAMSVELLPSGVLVTLGNADIHTCVTPAALACQFGFLLAQQPNGEVIDGFGVHGVATLPRVPICSDPFDPCPYPPRSEFRRLARQSVARTTHLARRALRTDVECGFEIQEPCEVRARFRTPRSHRTLAKVRPTSIAYGDAQPVRSQRLSGAELATIADRSHLEMKVVFSAEHQRPVRFTQGVRRRKLR